MKDTHNIVRLFPESGRHPLLIGRAKSDSPTPQRLKSIRASLQRINKLMAELRELGKDYND